MQRHGYEQPLKEFPAVLSDISDAFPDLLHQLYGLITPRASVSIATEKQMCVCSQPLDISFYRLSHSCIQF